MRPWDIELVCSGAGWVGTFGVAIHTVVEDILSDGAPFEAEIHYVTAEGESRTFNGKIGGVGNGRIYPEGAVMSIEIEGIRRFRA